MPLLPRAILLSMPPQLTVSSSWFILENVENFSKEYLGKLLIFSSLPLQGMNHCQPWSTTLNHYWPTEATTNHINIYKPLATMIFPPEMVMI
jgi:hypothetical protein